MIKRFNQISKKASLSGVSDRITMSIGSDSRIKERLDRLAFSWKVREELYRHMSVQLANDQGQMPALEKFKKRLIRNKRTSSAAVLSDIIMRLNDGAQLAVALRRWVPMDESLIVMGGENAGKLADSFMLIIDAKTRIRRVTRAFRSALFRPVVYLLALYALVWSIGEYMVPTLEAAPGGAGADSSSSIVILGKLATSYDALFPVVGLCMLIVWTSWALPNWTGKYRTRAEHYFPFNFYRDIQGFIWITSFSNMLQAGMSDVGILKTQARQASPWLKQRLNAATRRLDNGMSLARSLLDSQLGFPNPDIIDDIESMADFDDFARRIAVRARHWADELQWKTETQVQRLGFGFEVAMYGLILYVLVGITNLSVHMGGSFSSY